MSDVALDSNKSNHMPVIQFSFGICVVLAIFTWIFDISFWKSMTIILSALVLMLLYAVVFLVQRVERLEKSRQYRLTRIYNKEGQEVMNRWTDQINSGHWVTITTDALKHDVLYAEHTRTDENTNAIGRENCISEEHRYNRSAVWGGHYGGPEYKIRIES